MENAPGQEETDSPSPLARFWAKTKEWCRTNPIVVSVFLFLALLFAVSQGIGVMKSIEDASQYARITSLPEMSMQSVLASIEKDKVKSIVAHDMVSGDILRPVQSAYVEVIFADGSSGAMEVVPEIREAMWKGLTDSAQKKKISFKEGYNATRTSAIKDAADIVLIVGLVILGFVLLHKSMGKMAANQGFEAHKRDKSIKLADVIGYEDVKREMREVMDQLERAPEYLAQGIKPPRGVIFTGDPGVGKTMMAKAMANELNADFFYCTGADFAEMYVGVGPKRVKNLFAKARQSKLAFIFIDEIDALGSRQSLGHDSERQATINQMLAEMDGVNENGQLLVMGATNHIDRLDPALVRPGRFDKQIYIPLPDTQTREGILKKYLDSIAGSTEVDLRALAQRTQGFSGAQLRAMVNESKNLALREARLASSNTVKVTQELLERAQEIAILGISERRSEGEEAHRIAVHELGHALVGYLCCPDIFIEKVTTIGRGGALGYTLSRPLTEGALKTEANLRGEIAMMLAGRAAEEIMLGSVSSGAGDDLRRANSVARKMVCQLGMGPSVGLVTPVDTVQPGHPLPPSVEADVKGLLDEVYSKTKHLISVHASWLRDRTDRLLEHGLMGHDALFEDVPKAFSSLFSPGSSTGSEPSTPIMAFKSPDSDRQGQQ